MVNDKAGNTGFPVFLFETVFDLECGIFISGIAF
jgi:hypothetical protein